MVAVDHRRFEKVGFLGEGGPVACKGLVPGSLQLCAFFPDFGKDRTNLVGYEKVGGRRPAEVFPGFLDLLCAQGGSVNVGGVLIGGAPIADVGADGNHLRLVFFVGKGFFGIGGPVQGIADGRGAVSVRDLANGPSQGPEACRYVFGEGQIGTSINGDVVPVIEADQIGESLVARKGGRLIGDPLHHVAIPAGDKDPGVEQGHAGTVEGRGKVAKGQGHPYGIRESLTQGAGGGFDPAGMVVFRVSWGQASPLTEGFQILEGQAKSCQVEKGVKQRRCVAARENEAIPGRPVGVSRVDPEIVPPEDKDGSGKPHGRSGMSRVGLLNDVNGEHAKGIDRPEFDLWGQEGVSHGGISFK